MTNFNRLVARVGEQAASHGRLVGYYEGRQALTYLAPEVRASLNNRLAAVSVNVPRLLVDSIAERLRIVGFSDPALWPAWTANRMESWSATAHLEALMLGEAYCIVWAHPNGTPKVTVESATQVAAELDPASGAVVSAVKKWEDRTGTHAIHFKADRVTRHFSPAMGATTGFRVVETLPNPLGIVPVVRFRNGDRLTHAGISEMLDVLPLTDALVKLTTDMLVASEYTARPRRWATGLELEEDKDGNAINPIPEGNRAMVSESAETKFGQLSGSDLGGYENALGVIMRQISAVSGLPEHMLGIGGDNPTSADSIRASEAALTAKAEARQRQFGRAWAEVAALMVAVQTGQDARAVDVTPVWADPSTRSEAAEADAVVKLVQAGVLPVTYALKRLGYTEAQITEIRAAIRTEALDRVGVEALTEAVAP